MSNLLRVSWVMVIGVRLYGKKGEQTNIKESMFTLKMEGEQEFHCPMPSPLNSRYMQQCNDAERWGRSALSNENQDIVKSHHPLNM